MLKFTLAAFAAMLLSVAAHAQAVPPVPPVPMGLHHEPLARPPGAPVLRPQPPAGGPEAAAPAVALAAPAAAPPAAPAAATTDAGPAPAQPVDPRLVAPAIAALQSSIAALEAKGKLMEAALGVAITDANAHTAEWAKWFADRDKAWGDYFAAYTGAAKPEAAP